MSSGLQRRRVGHNGPADHESPSQNQESVRSNSRNGNEDGPRIAYDPDDISTTAGNLKQPKLTLMEEVLLMGIKDKQVSSLNK